MDKSQYKVCLVIVLMSLVQLDVVGQKKPLKYFEENEKLEQSFEVIQQFNVQYLYGFNWGHGSALRDIITFEYERIGKYVTHYSFFDVSNISTNHGEEKTGTGIYGEWSPRLSLNSVTSDDISSRIIKDIYVASQLNFSEEFFAYLMGFGLGFQPPKGFVFLNIDALWRDTLNQDGLTWQITLSGLANFNVCKARFQSSGYFDLIGPEGEGERNIHSALQLLLYLDFLSERSGKFLIGAEFQFLKNEFGIVGRDQFVTQAMVKWLL